MIIVIIYSYLLWCNKSKLGSWLGTQRREENKLSPEKRKLLESLPQWSWDVLEYQWNEGFEYLKMYVEEYNHARPSAQLKYKNFNLGTWVSNQRRKENLSAEKIQQLESLPKWSWSPFEDQWNEGFECLKKYIKEHGHTKIPNRFKYENFNIGAWIGSQRTNKDNLDLERIKKLESLPEWSWNILEDQWNEGFEYLKKYVEEYGHAKVPARFKYQSFNLGTWAIWQRNGKHKLSQERIKKIELLPQWSWSIKSK